MRLYRRGQTSLTHRPRNRVGRGSVSAELSYSRWVDGQKALSTTDRSNSGSIRLADLQEITAFGKVQGMRFDGLPSLAIRFCFRHQWFEPQVSRLGDMFHELVHIRLDGFCIVGFVRWCPPKKTIRSMRSPTGSSADTTTCIIRLRVRILTASFI